MAQPRAGRPRPAAPAAESGSTTDARRRPRCSRSHTPGSLNESDPASSRPSCSHCGAAQVRRVHAVGDRPDRHLGGVESRPQLVEHGPAHPAVQQRDTVGALRQPQAHVGHVELGRIVLGAEREDPIRRHARQQRGRLIVVASSGVVEVALHHLHREPVDTGGHRGVGGEHGAGPHDRQRGVEVQSRVGDQLTDAFGAEEPGVPLVHVEHLGRGQPLDGGESANRPHPADAGQDLLLDAVFLVAAVQPVGDAAQVVLVFRDVGIQQQQRNPADLRDPDPRPQPRGVRQRQLDQHRITGGVGEQPQRQPLRVQRRIGLVLPAVSGQRLPEVPGAVVQADRDQRHAQIGRGLQVVAGQDPQAAGVIGQHLGDAELHREVRDAGGHRRRRPAAAAGTTADGSGSRSSRPPARRAGAGTLRRALTRRAARG